MDRTSRHPPQRARTDRESGEAPHHQLAAWNSICHMARDQEKQNAGEKLRQSGESQRQRAVRNFVHLPAHAYRLHLQRQHREQAREARMAENGAPAAMPLARSILRVLRRRIFVSSHAPLLLHRISCAHAKILSLAPDSCSRSSGTAIVFREISPMKQRKLGNAGPQVSVVGLGCNNFGLRIDLDGSRKVIHKALDLGITLFDTADIYGSRGGSETIIGQILGENRKRVVLATKFGGAMDEPGTMKGASRRYIMSAAEASLKRLRTDWIDLYQIHFPDPATPIEETLRALDDLVRAGKVRYIGCSNFAGWHLVDAQWTARHHGLHEFVSCQNEYSLLVRGVERELLPAMQKFGVAMLPYFP